jgi:hypothetical protein
MEVSGQFHEPTALPPGKSPQYPLDRWLGGPQSLPGRLGEEIILDPTGTRTPIYEIKKCKSEVAPHGMRSVLSFMKIVKYFKI